MSEVMPAPDMTAILFFIFSSRKKSKGPNVSFLEARDDLGSSATVPAMQEAAASNEEGEAASLEEMNIMS
jgi:hypothetical protein